MTDLGLFGPDSVAWRLHADPSMLAGGLRALLIQGLHPLAMAGVAEHSDFRTDPWGRLARTSEYVLVTTYGDTATALAAGARVRQVHQWVRGTDPVTGRPYRADDPELLAWIHNVEVDSLLTAYQRFGGCLSRADADRYVGEMVAVAELVGLRPDQVPHDVAGLRAYLDGVEGLMLTPAAKEGMRFILTPPLPLAGRALWTIPATAAVSLLPARLRRMYGLPWLAPAGPGVRLALFGLCRALNVARPLPPVIQEARARAEAAVA